MTIDANGRQLIAEPVPVPRPPRPAPPPRRTPPELSRRQYVRLAHTRALLAALSPLPPRDLDTLAPRLLAVAEQLTAYVIAGVRPCTCHSDRVIDITTLTPLAGTLADRLDPACPVHGQPAPVGRIGALHQHDDQEDDTDA